VHKGKSNTKLHEKMIHYSLTTSSSGFTFFFYPPPSPPFYPFTNHVRTFHQLLSCLGSLGALRFISYYTGKALHLV
jgi:hypothetical protein